MFQNQSLLVPTDFSPASRLSLDAAALLAQKFGAKVTLLHVFDPAPFALTASPSASISPEAPVAGPALEKQIFDELQRLREAHFATVPCETQIVHNASAPEAICAYAREHEIDLIVIATHGRTGLSHLLIGSVAEKVVRHAPCPVLTLRSKS